MKIALVALVLALSACDVTSEEPRGAGERRESPSPFEELEAKYRVHPRQLAKGGKPKATLHNTGATALEYGNDFTLERKTRVGWENIEQPDDARIFCAFTGEARLLQPGGETHQVISACNRDGLREPLKPGRYRVSKTVRHPHDPAVALTLQARFRVLEACGEAKPPPGLEISEREAIETIFGDKGVVNCKRFETKVSTRTGEPWWSVTFHEPLGCSSTMGVHAITGELSKYGSWGCP